MISIKRDDIYKVISRSGHFPICFFKLFPYICVLKKIKSINSQLWLLLNPLRAFVLHKTW